MKTKLSFLLIAMFGMLGVSKAQCAQTATPTQVFGTPGTYTVGVGPAVIQICSNVTLYDTLGSNQRHYYLLPGAHVIFKGGFANFVYMQGNSTYQRIGSSGSNNYVYYETTATVTGSLTQTNTCTTVSFPTVACSGPTGIKEYSETGLLTVFPNPANGFVNVINDHAQDVIASIVNSVGKVERVVVLSHGSNTIDLYGMAEGIYFINVSAGDGSIARGKIIVTN